MKKIAIQPGSRLEIRLTAVAVLIIVVLVNLIWQRIPFEFDFSAGKLYSVGEETKAVLKGLDNNVVIYGLFDEGKSDEEYLELEQLLKRYVSFSGGRVRVVYADPDRNTGIVRELDPAGTLGLKKGDFFVSGGGRGRKLGYKQLFQMQYDQRTSTWFHTGSLAEQAFTGAIRYTGMQQAETVYVAAGSSGNGAEAYSEFLTTVQKEGYEVKTLDLESVSSIPKDAAVLLVLSPTEDLTAQVAKKLAAFLDGGGNAAFLFDASEQGLALPGYNALLSGYGLQVNHDRMRAGGETGQTQSRPYHLLLDVKQSDVIPLEFYGLSLQNTRSLQVGDSGGQDYVTSVLARTDHNTVAEGGDSAAASTGAYAVAAVSQKNRSPKTKVFVAGCAWFLSDAAKTSYPAYFGTGSYFMTSALEWLHTKAEAAQPATKSYVTGELQISKPKADYIGFFTIVAVPLSIFGYGFSVWQKRRYL